MAEQADNDQAERHPGGRPTEFKPEFVEQASKLCARGFTNAELADFFNVHPSTLYRWMDAHPEFRDTIKDAGAIADDRVERSLYQRAIGYEQDAVKIFMPAGAEKPVYAKYREAVVPDTASAIFWLKNRRKTHWRDKNEIEQYGKDGEPLIPSVNVNITHAKS